MSLNTPDELRTYISAPESVIDDVLQLYLDAAYVIVDEELSTVGYSSDRLKLIELNLAAHFATNGPSVTGGTYTSGQLEYIKVGSSEERYATMSNSSWGIATSVYGQIAMALDTSGKLAGQLASKPLKARFSVI